MSFTFYYATNLTTPYRSHLNDSCKLYGDAACCRADQGL
jgi:hypothetical protein